MTRIPLEIPPGMVSDDTTFAAAGRWADGSNVRFWENYPQVVGGWESLMETALTGVCRNVFPWTDRQAVLNVAFGTHGALQVWKGGGAYDITPTLAKPAAILADPFAVTDGSAVVTITQAGHGLIVGESVTISGAVAVGRVTIAGTFAITPVDVNSYTITNGAPADTVKTLGSDPLTTLSGSPVVTVAETAHNIVDGTTINISGATAVGGITPAGAFAITVIDANSYSFRFTSNASSTATGGGAAVVVTVPATGGGSVVKSAPQTALAVGSIDGTGGAGFGTGSFSTGTFSSPSTADYFPRTWSLSAWGENLIATPRNGAIYAWSNDTATIAAPLLNSPQQVTASIVSTKDQVFALGCNEEASGLFNPLCIRHSSIRNDTEWNTANNTTAREYVLPGGGRIVAGRLAGEYLLVWTSHSLFLGRYIGQVGQVWRFDRVGDKCGLIGPNAVVVVGQTAYWLGVDLQFHQYSLGGAVSPLDCPIRADMADNITASQADKIAASSISKFNEIRFDYPDARDGFENSRYLSLSLNGQGWHRGQMARTAFVDAGPSVDPIGVTFDGMAYWHERGASADGSSLSWFIKTADQYLDPNYTMVTECVWPDLKNQIGPVYVTLESRLKPQDTSRTQGPVAMAFGDSKADLRLSGRLFNITFSGSSAPSSVRIGKPVFDATRAGKR